MNLLEYDERDGYIYDVVIKQFDTNFFKQISGTTTVASNKLRFTSASAASYLLHEYCQRATFKINVPVKPTAGDSRRWGFYSPAASATQGGIFFDITGDVFSVVVIDDAGTSTSKTLTWTDATFSAHDILFEIEWEPSIVRVYVNGSIVATFAPTQSADNVTVSNIPSLPLPIYINNGNADNMDVSYFLVRKAAGVV